MKRNVKAAVEQLKTLRDSKFFALYPELVTEKLDFEEKYASYLDTETQAIKDAAKYFFFNHKVLNVKSVRFEDKVSGIQVSPKNPVECAKLALPTSFLTLIYYFLLIFLIVRHCLYFDSYIR